MKYFLPFIILLLCVVGTTEAQWLSNWYCDYSTYDDETNGTGYNTTAVGVIKENYFVSLIMRRNDLSFLIPYANADSAKGRVNYCGYDALSGYFQVWSDGGFDQVEMKNAFKIAVTKDSLIYAACNDPDHNILVFKFTGDTTTAYANASGVYCRNVTGTDGLHGIAVDKDGYVYVCADTTTDKTQDVKIYPPIKNWQVTHTEAPVKTIDLPNGIYKGICVSPDAKSIFISDYKNRKILKYKGSVASGFTLDTQFNYQMVPGDTVQGWAAQPSILGLAYMPNNNILLAASDVYLVYSYQWAKIALINPYTGAPASADSNISIIDQAKWNFLWTGSYSRRTGGTTPGNVSGYGSTFDVTLDEKNHVYTVSHYGWTVERWTYKGTLPVIAGVEEVSNKVPESFLLSQNYPNPFNPVTTIEFTVPQENNVTLVIYNVVGEAVAKLVSEQLIAGTYKVRWDASNMPSGVYFYRLQVGNLSATKKLMLVR